MLYERIIKREPIDLGWSTDEKFKVTMDDGMVYLLRISPTEKYENRRRLFVMQRKAEELSIPMCRAVEFGVSAEGVYSLQTWIDGQDAEAVIPKLPVEEQYSLGLSAGRMIRKIHSIPAPEGIPDWGEKFSGKIDRKIRMYEECPLKLEGGEYLLDYIEKNRYLIQGRPQSFQHGDFHIGNMMLSCGELYIIDFDRYDFGDPWEEFNRIVWSAEAAPEFARGTIDGYFEGEEIPEMFWRLLALYISSNMLSALPWAIPFGEGEIKVMRNQARDILSWYGNMTKIIPSWYNRKEENHETK